MKHFLLFYEAGPDYLERRPQFRAMHLNHAWAAYKWTTVIGDLAATPVRPEDL
jgi:hypothetical protein